MKILVSSDFHGRAKAFQEIAIKATENNVDVIVVCGDVTQFGTLQQVKEFLSILTALKLPLFFVLGNCDPLVSLNATWIEGAIYIHGFCKTYENVVFFGVGTTTTKQFTVPEDGIAHVLNEAFNSCSQIKGQLVLVSHFPPKDTKLDIAFMGGHVGSYSLRNFIEEKKPALVFCGHIHESRGIDKIDNTIIVNPGPASHGCYALVELNKEIKVILSRSE